VKAGTKRKKREAAEREALSERRRNREAHLTTEIKKAEDELQRPYVMAHLKRRHSLQAKLLAYRSELDALWADVDREAKGEVA